MPFRNRPGFVFHFAWTCMRYPRHDNAGNLSISIVFEPRKGRLQVSSYEFLDAALNTSAQKMGLKIGLGRL